MLRSLLSKDTISLDEVAAHLDSLNHDERVRQVRSVPGGLQGPLFESAKGFAPLSLEDMIPREIADRAFVRHYGKNSLPAFSHFEKRFARPAVDADTAWGYNHSSAMWLVGPGHFVLREGPDEGEMHVDYYAIPPEQLDGAPALKSNTAGISTLVYGNMIDVLRRVSIHVTIGRAIKKGKETSNYFLLCREG